MDVYRARVSAANPQAVPAGCVRSRQGRKQSINTMILPAQAPPVAGGLAKVWAEHAEDLSAWTWWRMVNRADVWGGYFARPDGTVGPLTHPQVSQRGKHFLSPDVLWRHFRARATDQVVGLHTTNEDNRCLWCAVDVDRHGEQSPPAEANLAAATSWYHWLRLEGFHPLLSDSNGSGGYHLRVLFRRPQPSTEVYRFTQALVADYGDYGLDAPPEVFPKQPTVSAPGSHGQYGNWLRVPGRHPKRLHWSRIFDGREWLEGAAAIAFILALEGDADA